LHRQETHLCNDVRLAIKSGWRKPAVVGGRSCSQTAFMTANTFPSHGGLTPAAPVNVRLCTANVAIFQWTGVVHQERLA
jgi:hypothetical protein